MSNTTFKRPIPPSNFPHQSCWETVKAQEAEIAALKETAARYNKEALAWRERAERAEVSLANAQQVISIHQKAT